MVLNIPVSQSTRSRRPNSTPSSRHDIHVFTGLNICVTVSRQRKRSLSSVMGDASTNLRRRFLCLLETLSILKCTSNRLQIVLGALDDTGRVWEIQWCLLEHPYRSPIESPRCNLFSGQVANRLRSGRRRRQDRFRYGRLLVTRILDHPRAIAPRTYQLPSQRMREKLSRAPETIWFGSGMQRLVSTLATSRAQDESRLGFKRWDGLDLGCAEWRLSWRATMLSFAKVSQVVTGWHANFLSRAS